MATQNGWGYVYVIKSSNGLHKIGLASDVNRRFGELKRRNPTEHLELIRTIETFDMGLTEDQLHARFDKKRVHGEWFNLDESDFSFIDLIERNTKECNDILR